MVAQQTLSQKCTSLYSGFFFRFYFICLTVFPLNLVLAQDYRGVNISGDDLSEQDLTGALFDNTTIFSDGTNGVNLSNTEGTGANLSGISGAVDFRGVNLTGVNLSSANLSSANIDDTTIFSNGTVGANLANSSLDLSNADFSNADFRGVNLTGVNMTDTDLTGATFSSTTIFSDGFTGANLASYNSNGANLKDLNFSTADFRGVNLTGVNLTNSVLTGANIDNTTIFSSVSGGGFGTSVGANLTNYNEDANLSGLDLSNVDFRGVNLTGVDLTNADLTTATFDSTTVFSTEAGGFGTGTSVGANLTNTSSNGADLSNISFGAVDFRGVNLTGVNLSGANLSSANINNTTIFSNGTVGANLANSSLNLSNADFSNADFRGVNLTGVNMTDTDLTGASFSSTTIFSDGTTGANLSNTLSNGADFRDLNLSATDFRGVNLAGVNLTNALLTGANIDYTTVFSTGGDFGTPTGANLSNTNGDANLSGLDLNNVDFRGVNLSGVDLTNADLSAAMFDSTTIFTDGISIGVNLSNTNGTGANLWANSLSNVDFRWVNLTGVNLMDSDLSGAIFDSTTIFSNGTIGANLSNGMGNGANLTDLYLNGVDFRGVNLTGVNLSNATLSSNQYSLVTYDTNTIFSDGVNGANLSNTMGTGAVLLNISPTIDLRGVNLVGVSFYDNDEGESSNLEEALIDRTTIFSDGTIGANLTATFANLAGQDLTGVDFRGANIAGVNLRNSNLTNALFNHMTIFADIDGGGANLYNDLGTGANLSGIDFSLNPDTKWGFEGVNLVGVNLSNAVLSDGESTSYVGFADYTDFSNGTIGVNLSNQIGKGAILTGFIEFTGNFRGVNLVGAKFSNSILEETNLFDKTTIFSDGVYGVDLSDTWANLSGLDLSNVDFRGVNLNSTSLSGSNLNGANFTDSQLTDSNLSSAQYNSFTTWPAGYDPDAQGAIRTDQKFHDYLNELVSSTYQESNQSGVNAAIENPNSYDLYRQEDGSLVEVNNTNPNYQSGYNDGYNSSYNAIRENPGNYGLYSEQDRNKTILNESTRVLAKVQAEFAMEGMSLVSYQEKVLDSNATQTSQWYYQPELGWVWTTRSAYPYLYKAGSIIENTETIMEGWMFHNKSGPDNYYFYDFDRPGWIDPF
jgi:uncharacterized protein YjbI with pentapeptide repeats